MLVAAVGDRPAWSTFTSAQVIPDFLRADVVGDAVLYSSLLGAAAGLAASRRSSKFFTDGMLPSGPRGPERTGWS